MCLIYPWEGVQLCIVNLCFSNALKMSDCAIEEWESASEDESSENISSGEKFSFSRIQWKPPQVSLLTLSLNSRVEAMTVCLSLLSFRSKMLSITYD